MTPTEKQARSAVRAHAKKLGGVAVARPTSQLARNRKFRVGIEKPVWETVYLGAEADTAGEAWVSARKSGREKYAEQV